MKEITVTLAQPVMLRGVEVSSVTVRPSTVGDEEDAMQQAIQLKKARNPVTVEMCLLSRVARVPYDVLRSMNGRDYAALRGALNSLNGTAPDGDADPLASLTMPESD